MAVDALAFTINFGWPWNRLDSFSEAIRTFCELFDPDRFRARP